MKSIGSGRTATTLGVGVAMLALSVSGVANAQSQTEVTTSVGTSSRQLSVTDLTGQPLTALPLRPGVGAPFAVRVTDSGMEPTPFQVTAVMNDLYLEHEAGGHDFSVTIPSSQVAVGWATTPIDAVGASLDVEPGLLVQSAVGAVDCADVSAVLGLTPLEALADPVCSLVDDLLDGAGVVVDPVELGGELVEDVDLGGLHPDALPVGLAPSDLDTGPFTRPDCANGIAVGHAGCDDGGAATARTLLRGRPVTGALLGDLGDLVADALGATAIAPDASAVVAALQASTDQATSQLGNRLAQYGAAEQGALVTALFDLVDGAVDADDLSGLTGTWMSFPTLRVDPTTTASGTYAGTMTVTLVEP